MRKTWSLIRRDLFTVGSPQPVSGTSLQQGVERHYDQDDDDHRQRQRLGITWLTGSRLAREQRLDLERQDHTTLGEERRSRRVGRESVGEEQQTAAEERREQQRARDVAPVVPRPAAQAVCRLAPLGTDAVQRGR